MRVIFPHSKCLQYCHSPNVCHLAILQICAVVPCSKCVPYCHTTNVWHIAILQMRTILPYSKSVPYCPNPNVCHIATLQMCAIHMTLNGQASKGQTEATLVTIFHASQKKLRLKNMGWAMEIRVNMCIQIEGRGKTSGRMLLSKSEPWPVILVAFSDPPPKKLPGDILLHRWSLQPTPARTSAASPPILVALF